MAESAHAEVVQPGEPAIPSHVWNPEVLKDLHAKQHDISTRNIKSLDDQREREYRLGLAGIALFCAIVAFGCYWVAVGNAFGKDILGGTVMFLAGYLAGFGQGKTLRG